MAAEVSVTLTSQASVPELPTKPLIYSFERATNDDFLVIKFQLAGDAQFDVDYRVDEYDSGTIHLPDEAMAGPVVGTATFFPGESTVRMKVIPQRDSAIERDEIVAVSILEATEFDAVHGAATFITDDSDPQHYLLDEANRLGIVDIETGVIDVLGTVDVSQTLNDIAFLEDGTLFGISNNDLFELQFTAVENGVIPVRHIAAHHVDQGNALVDARHGDFGSEIGDLLVVGFNRLQVQRIDMNLIDETWTYEATTPVFDIANALAVKGYRSSYASSGDLDYLSDGDLVLSAQGAGDPFDSLIRFETPGDVGVIQTAPVAAGSQSEIFMDVYGLSFGDRDKFAFAAHTMLTVNQFSLKTVREVEMLGRPYELGAEIVAVGTIVGDPVTPPQVSLNVGLIDAPSLPHGIMPTTWLIQRSDLRRIRIKLGAPVTSVSTSELALTSLGLSDAAPPINIPLSQQQLQLSGDGKTIEILLDHEQLPDGRYQLDVASTLTTGPHFTMVGDSVNRFFSIDGDFDGNRVVDIRDYATLAYWYGQTTAVAPAYVDLDGSGMIDQGDVSQFNDNFTLFVDLPGQPNPRVGEYLRLDELTRANHSIVNALDVSGDARVSPLDALQVINRLALGMSNNLDWRYDVNRDGEITPRDALFVINQLARQAGSSAANVSLAGGESNGEGEFLPERSGFISSITSREKAGVFDNRLADAAISQLFES